MQSGLARRSNTSRHFRSSFRSSAKPTASCGPAAQPSSPPSSRLAIPYFLPGVLSLWKDSALFGGELRGLTLAGTADRTYHGELPGNHPLSRRDVHRVSLLNDFISGPIGLCIHVGYTRTIPIALSFRKTGATFDWPEHLGAPAWYVPLAAGIEAFSDKRAAQAGDLFRKLLT